MREMSLLETEGVSGGARLYWVGVATGVVANAIYDATKAAVSAAVDYYNTPPMDEGGGGGGR